MVKAATTARMDMANKALCFALRNPPAGLKKVAFNVTLLHTALLIIYYFLVLGPAIVSRSIEIEFPGIPVECKSILGTNLPGHAQTQNGCED